MKEKYKSLIFAIIGGALQGASIDLPFPFFKGMCLVAGTYFLILAFANKGNNE